MRIAAMMPRTIQKTGACRAAASARPRLRRRPRRPGRRRRPRRPPPVRPPARRGSPGGSRRESRPRSSRSGMPPSRSSLIGTPSPYAWGSPSARKRVFRNRERRRRLAGRARAWSRRRAGGLSGKSRVLRTAPAALALLAAAGASAAPADPPAADHAAPKEKAKDAARADVDLPPLPADRSIRQTATIAGRRIAYTATIATIPVRDDKGKTTGEVVVTAYTVPGHSAAERPVTFAFNGGPGAASVYLNLGAIGPKRVAFGQNGDAPSDQPILRDNPTSWLDFTDLVFVDPIGTGFSRSLLDKDETKKRFYTAGTDIEYLSRVVYDWLVRNGRLTTRKYLVGESYGGYRVPRLAYQLQTKLGVGISGITMVSPYLDPPAIGEDDALSPLPWMINLPAMAAAISSGRASRSTPRRWRPSSNMIAPSSSPTFSPGRATRRRPIASPPGWPSSLGSIPRSSVGSTAASTSTPICARSGALGRDRLALRFERHRLRSLPGQRGEEVSRSAARHADRAATSAMVDFVTNQVGWKVDAHYEALSDEVNLAWERDKGDTPVSDLRKAIAIDPRMAVTIVHGWDDLSCPYFASRLILAQLPSYGRADRVRLLMYPGGHMFYARPDSGAALRRDILAAYGVAS
ncbi:hypothetical protein SLE2022_405800 [Rubroshorea leprosula]